MEEKKKPEFSLLKGLENPKPRSSKPQKYPFCSECEFWELLPEPEPPTPEELEELRADLEDGKITKEEYEDQMSPPDPDDVLGSCHESPPAPTLEGASPYPTTPTWWWCGKGVRRKK